MTVIDAAILAGMMLVAFAALLWSGWPWYVALGGAVFAGAVAWLAGRARG